MHLDANLLCLIKNSPSFPPFLPPSVRRAAGHVELILEIVMQQVVSEGAGGWMYRAGRHASEIIPVWTEESQPLPHSVDSASSTATEKERESVLECLCSQITHFRHANIYGILLRSVPHKRRPIVSLRCVRSDCWIHIKGLCCVQVLFVCVCANFGGAKTGNRRQRDERRNVW